MMMIDEQSKRTDDSSRHSTSDETCSLNMLNSTSESDRAITLSDDEDISGTVSAAISSTSMPISSAQMVLLDPSSCNRTTFQNAVINDVKPNRLKTKFYQFIRKVLWIFPLLIVILVPFACLTPYTLALQRDHVHPIFPYVSDAGGIEPQAAYFSQILDVIAILIFVTALIRYKMIKHCIRSMATKTICVEAVRRNAKSIDAEHRTIASNTCIDRYNFNALLIVCVAAFGLSVIGSFRVTEIAVGHFLGVTFAFGGMFVYMCLMIRISFHLANGDIESKPYTMLAICVIAGISLVSCLAFSIVSIAQVGWERFFENNFRLRWKENEVGYTAHIAGTSFEWVAINTVGPFYLCLFVRIKRFTDWQKVSF